ncbi:protein XRI1 [Cucumis melo var. makuwa]|uniref:Protein XRI1 n=1 Tax=Cucumis melo var. makuwa TaxID=1194695 RepID=A0A5A7VPU6_CUCMM|nr:protein XRI1 [Cucumis melo var. makuwa]
MEGGGAAVIDPCFSPAISTGYLEDALLEYTSKRRRLDHDQHHFFQFEFPQSSYHYWNHQIDDMNNDNYYYYNYDAISTGGFSLHYSIVIDEGISSSPKSRLSNEETSMEAIMKTQDVETYSTPNYYYEHHHHHPNSSSSSSSKSHKFEADQKSIFSMSTNLPISTGDGEIETKKAKKRKVVYPFALVKPGGVEGDVTLNDINQKILMPPTRPVRHPVGDFACRPCVSADGPGLSGKAVVALTKIHTQGRRGTITIIRTKG